MILEFCVSNFLSIKDELKLSFVATTLKESLSEPNDVIPLSDMGLSLVRSAVIYGANASGKTNVLKAIAFYKRFIMDSFKNSQAGESIDVENFRLNISTVHEPTMMEATFAVGEYIYRYGFEVAPKAIHAEWLYRRMNRKRAKEVEIFYREGETTTVHAKSPLIQDLVNKKMVRGNALLLSTYNPQNEMFRRFRTKCSISQNETYLRESFYHPHQPNKKAPKEQTSLVLFIVLLFGSLAKNH